MNMFELESLMQTIDDEQEVFEKTASVHEEDACQEARKVAHVLRNAPVSDTVDLHTAFNQATKIASAKAREYFGASPDIFKPLDWEDGLFILGGGNYDYTKRN